MTKRPTDTIHVDEDNADDATSWDAVAFVLGWVGKSRVQPDVHHCGALDESSDHEGHAAADAVDHEGDVDEGCAELDDAVDAGCEEGSGCAFDSLENSKLVFLYFVGDLGLLTMDAKTAGAK